MLFLKELYRFQNLSKIEHKTSRIVFLVSIRPESLLSSAPSAVSETVFSKLFEFTITLSPIHFEDYEAIILALIASDKDKKSRLTQMFPNETFENALPKVANNGNFWGAFKTADGASKFAQLQSAGPLTTTTTQSIAAINPATMMMAVALFSIEQKLGEIEKMQKQIISFLEIEKESEIEADVEMLSNIISKYKLNWDNEHFVASNHKLVLDIQRTARKNMNGYQKKVAEVLNSKKFVVMQNQVKSALKDLQKKFKYYRLSLYTFSMASMMEIMLSGNFKEEYIAGIKEEIEKLSSDYRDLFVRCSVYLEKISGVFVEANVLKGIGTASKAVGKFIGNIPLVKEGQVDEFLQDSGKHIKSNAKELEMSAITAFAEINNPETRVFIDRMQDMIQIYNHTGRICFDDKKIYLIAG